MVSSIQKPGERPCRVDSQNEECCLAGQHRTPGNSKEGLSEQGLNIAGGGGGEHQLADTTSVG